LVIGFCALIATTSYLMVFTLLGQIGEAFHASASSVDWIAIATLIVGTMSSALFPALGTHLGHRRLIVLAMGCLAAGSLVSAVAPDIAVMFCGRILAAFGLAAVVTGVAILRRHLPDRALLGALSVIAGFEGLAAATGFGVGGIVESLFAADWRAVFWILALVAAFGAGLAALVVPDGDGASTRRLDLRGAVLLCSALVALMLPITEASSWGWDSPGVIVLFAIGAVLLAGWCVTELRSKAPLVELRVLARPSVAIAVLLFAAFGGTVGIINITVPSFLEAPLRAGYGFGDSVLQSGLIMLPFAAAITVAGYSSRWLARRATPRSIAMASMALELAAMALLAGFHQSLAEVVPEVALFGLGHGGMIFATYAIVTRGAPRNDAGSVAGLAGASSGVGGAIVTALATALLVSRLLAPGSLPAASGYAHAWLLGAALAAGGLGLACSLSRAASPEAA
jgi:MFS family permease